LEAVPLLPRTRTIQVDTGFVPCSRQRGIARFAVDLCQIAPGASPV